MLKKIVTFYFALKNKEKCFYSSVHCNKFQVVYLRKYHLNCTNTVFPQIDYNILSTEAILDHFCEQRGNKQDGCYVANGDEDRRVMELTFTV